MAYINRNHLLCDGKNCLNNWENINLISTPETIRILLFKECRLRDRQLIFDSHSSQNVENRTDNSFKNFKNENKTAEEFPHLTEMIFGSTAMKYHHTYYKIHDVSSPNRLIFTQVFSTPKNEKFQINSESSFSKSFQRGSSLLDYDLSGNSLSRASIDSTLDCFSIFRKNTWNSTNSTSTTIDSGFSESSFSSNSSFQPSYGSFTRRDKMESSNASLNIYNSFLSDMDSPSISQNLNYSRLGLVLIVPVTMKTYGNENIYIQHITFIESILWRVRQYVELALNSPKFFFATMFEISSISGRWLSKELHSWTRKYVDERSEDSGGIFRIFGLLNLRKSIFFMRTSKDEHFEKFCRTLNDLDIKETKFFLSTLLTAVLTHNTGWVYSCYSLNELNISDSYNAIWRQLTSLYGASGYLTKCSKTVIYGVKNVDTLNKVLDFLQYFIRYFRVERRYVERGDILQENKIVDDICDNVRQNKPVEEFEVKMKKPGLVKSKKFCMDLSTIVDKNEENLFRNNDGKKKGFVKTKTFGQRWNILDYTNEQYGYENEEDLKGKSVLFILGDNDKLQNLKKSTNVNKENDESKNGNMIKLKVITFPLPKIKSIGDFSEVVPHEFLPENGVSDIYVPDKIFQATITPYKKWKQALKNDLSFKSSCLFSNQLDENVAVLANSDTWDVQLLSSNRNKTEAAVDTSPLVSNILEVVVQMWKLNMAKEHCASFIEQRLVEICLRANALSQFLLTTDFCTMETLLTTLNLNILDVPLLMSVGSNINPEILQKYGISYQ